MQNVASIFSIIASVAAVKIFFKLKNSKAHTLYYLRKKKKMQAEKGNRRD